MPYKCTSNRKISCQCILKYHTMSLSALWTSTVIQTTPAPPGEASFPRESPVPHHQAQAGGSMEHQEGIRETFGSASETKFLLTSQPGWKLLSQHTLRMVRCRPKVPAQNLSWGKGEKGDHSMSNVTALMRFACRGWELHRICSWAKSPISLWHQHPCKEDSSQYHNSTFRQNFLVTSADQDRSQNTEHNYLEEGLGTEHCILTFFLRSTLLYAFYP